MSEIKFVILKNGRNFSTSNDTWNGCLIQRIFEEYKNQLKWLN